SYNRKQYYEETIRSLAEMYRKNLCEIIEHCTGKETPEVTPYDVGNKELSIEEVSNILSFYDNIIQEYTEEDDEYKNCSARHI
uniref:hypothetical protein n=1 Tax=Ruminiclostridium cellobioparum TaxID=29355 RepID=UPI000551C81E